MATKNKVGLFWSRSAIVIVISCVPKGISSPPFIASVNNVASSSFSSRS